MQRMEGWWRMEIRKNKSYSNADRWQRETIENKFVSENILNNYCPYCQGNTHLHFSKSEGFKIIK